MAKSGYDGCMCSAKEYIFFGLILYFHWPFNPHITCLHLSAIDLQSQDV